MEIHNLRSVFPFGGIYIHVQHNSKHVRQDALPKEPTHIHDYCELYLNVRGNVSFSVENRIYPIESGNLILTKPNEFHSCIYNDDTEHECYCLWIRTDSTLSYLLDPFINRENGEKNRICLSKTDKLDLISLLENLLSQERADTLTSIDSIATLSNIFQFLEQHKQDAELSTNLPSVLLQITDYIDSNFEKDCSVKALCDRFFISRSSINRLFKTNLCTTPSKYLENKRLANAKRLLSQQTSVQTVCNSCGFPDYSHFIALFRRRFGITPLQYQKSLNQI